MSPPGEWLVTGANGMLGRLLIRRLATGEGPRPGVRAAVRSERAAETLRSLKLPEPPRIELVDYADAGSLARAAEGCRVAVHLVGILKENARSRYTEAHETTCSALARAARKVGLERIVYVSIVGATPGSRNPCLASKGRAEVILHQGSVAAAVLRFPMVLGPDDPATRALRARAAPPLVPLVRGGASLEQPLDALDAVEAVVRAADSPAAARQSLDLGGPECLPRRELIHRAAAILGRRPPRIVPVPFWLARSAATLAAAVLADPPITPAMLGVLEQDDCVDNARALGALGLELTPLDTTLRRVLTA